MWIHFLQVEKNEQVEKLDLEHLTKWLQFGWEIIYKK